MKAAVLEAPLHCRTFKSGLVVIFLQPFGKHPVCKNFSRRLSEDGGNVVARHGKRKKEDSVTHSLLGLFIENTAGARMNVPAPN